MTSCSRFLIAVAVGMLTAGPALADRPHNLNLAQQQYFLEMTLKVVLPGFKQIGKPFVLVFWSRDPDGTQHNQGDRGINGPTSMTAIRTADGALAAIEQQLKALGLFETTNIIVAADHGFSTVSKESENGSRELPPGFLAVDLQAALQKEDSNLKLYDPDEDNKIIDPANAHPGRGDGLIGTDPKLPQVVVAANGGSDRTVHSAAATPGTSWPRVARTAACTMAMNCRRATQTSAWRSPICCNFSSRPKARFWAGF